MKKRVFAVLAICLIFALCACGANNAKPCTEFIGAGDDELVSARGQGKATFYTISGEQVIQQRRYQEKLFGLSARVEYLFSDVGDVNQIVATFPETSEQQLVEAVSKTLGEPDKLQQQSTELDFMARWEADGIAYICRRGPNADLYILMEKL